MVNRKHVKLSVSLLTVILLCSLGGFAYGQSGGSSNAVNIYLDDLPASATYTIKFDGVNYWAAKSDGSVLVKGTNGSQVYNQAAASLSHTHQQVIELTGEAWSINAPLLAYAHETLIVKTSISLAAGSNCDMLLTADTNNFHCFILDGGDWDGNSASQSTGHIFNLGQTAEYAGSEPCVIRNVHAKEGYNDIIHLYNTYSYSMIWDIHDNVLGECGNAGIYINELVDSLVHDNIIQGNSYNLYMIGGNNIISNNYYSGAGVCNIYLYGNTFQFNGGFIDCRGKPAIICDGVERSQFNDLTIRSVSVTGDNTFDAIILQRSSLDATTNCIKNNFNAILIYQTGGCRFRCGINETDANQNGNIFGVINAPTGVGAATGTAAVRRLGASSLASNYTIIGSIVTS